MRNFRLLGKGLSFFPKIKSQHKIRVAQKTFRYSRRLRLKQYFYNLSSTDSSSQDNANSENDYVHLPFFNKKPSTLTPKLGRDEYLDFYIEAVTQEILQTLQDNSRHTNISKEEMQCLKSLSRDKDIIIKKADKSGTIVVMNRQNYVGEVHRQLNNESYYEKVGIDYSATAERNISECVKTIQETNSCVVDEFDTFPENVRIPQFYILPKIHKEYNESLPLGYPGRPIVSACNSCTDHISKYIDYNLQPLMKSLPSYVKDNTDFILKLKQYKLNSQKHIL